VTVALTILGAVVVLTVLQDVFTTVLFPSSTRGVIRKPLSRAVWAGFRGLARRLPAARGRRLLTFSGPVIITVNLAAWVVLLVVGFAWIYQPALGDGIRAASGSTDTSWTTALYYSGFSGTTLGVGDVAATSGVYRLLTVVQAALGFGGITMAITYFLSVYGNLTARNAAAQGLHHRTAGTGDAAELVVGFADGGDLAAGRQELASTAGYFRHLCQSHGFYPVLRYFHYERTAYALPRVLLLALDATALIRSAVDDRHGEVLRSRSLDELLRAGSDLLDQLVPDVEVDPPPRQREERWRHRYADARKVLDAAGIAVVDDPDAYVSLRAEWDDRLRALSDGMGYRWGDIDVHDR
jgi:hypothetical protein